MIIKNISWASITIDYKGSQITMSSNAIVSLPEDKANELIRLYEDKFQEVTDISSNVWDLSDYQKKLTEWDWIDISDDDKISCTLEADDFDIKDLADSTNILAWKQPVATSWEWAPESTPTAIGLFYLDTTNSKMYMSFGTTAATDWKEISIVSE